MASSRMSRFREVMRDRLGRLQQDLESDFASALAEVSAEADELHEQLADVSIPCERLSVDPPKKELPPAVPSTPECPGPPRLAEAMDRSLPGSPKRRRRLSSFAPSVQIPPSPCRVISNSRSPSSSRQPRGLAMMSPRSTEPSQPISDMGSAQDYSLHCSNSFRPAHHKSDTTLDDSAFHAYCTCAESGEMLVVAPQTELTESIKTALGAYGWLVDTVLATSRVEEPERKGLLANIVFSKVFDAICMTAIVVNAAVTIYEADYALEHNQQGQQLPFVVVEYFFVAIYVIELILKIAVHRLYFFTTRWNYFDFVLVMMAIVNLVLSDFMELAWLRTLRILKIIRILRMVRAVGMIRDLRVMMESLYGCASSLFWTFVMLLFILLLFAIFFVQGVADYFKDAAVSDGEREAVTDSFGSVSLAMLTLFKATTGGADWEQTYDQLFKAGPHMGIIFLFFIVMFMLAVFNIVTSVFIEEAMASSKPTPKEMMHEQRKIDFLNMKELAFACEKAGFHANDVLVFEDFKAIIRSKAVQYWFTTRGVDISNTKKFFRMLIALNGSSSINVATLVRTCMRLAGNVSRLDLQLLALEISYIQRSHRRFQYRARRYFANAEASARVNSMDSPSTDGDQSCGVAFPL